MPDKIAIDLTDAELKFVQRCLNEACAGASSGEILRICGSSNEALRDVVAELADHHNLTEAQWRMVYDMVHATIYGLGQFELFLTGFTLPQAINFNLRIASRVWGVYGESRF